MAEISDAELAELRKKAHSWDSEGGRLQKTQQELDQERAQRAEAEKRLAAAEQQQVHTQFDPQTAAVFGADGAAALQTMLSPLLGKLDNIGKRFDEQATADTQARALRAFQDGLNSKLADRNLPGFASRLFGGDLAGEWAKFVEARPSVRRAQSEGDIEAVSDVIATFIHQNKEQVAGGGYSPQAMSGMSPAIKSDYSDADYHRDVTALDRKLANLTITEDEHKAQVDALGDRYDAAQEKLERSVAAYGLV